MLHNNPFFILITLIAFIALSFQLSRVIDRGKRMLAAMVVVRSAFVYLVMILYFIFWQKPSNFWIALVLPLAGYIAITAILESIITRLKKPAQEERKS